jgi:DNA replication protein DnaC
LEREGSRKSWDRGRTNSADGKWNGLEVTQSLCRKRRRRRRRRKKEEIESDKYVKDLTCSCFIIAGRPDHDKEHCMSNVKYYTAMNNKNNEYELGVQMK